MLKGVFCNNPFLFNELNINKNVSLSLGTEKCTCARGVCLPRYSRFMSENILESGKLYELWAWYEVHRKKINTWAVIIVAIGVAIAYAVWSAGQKQLNASTALFQLGEPVRVIAEGEVPATDLLKVAEQYAGTAAAEQALLEAGVAYFTTAEYQKALDTFNRFEQEYPGSSFEGIAVYGSAVSLDGLGKDDEAIELYQKIAGTYPMMAEQAKMGMGAIYESKGDLEKAMATYRDITTTSRGGWYRNAYMRIQALELAHPELKEKPATPATKAATTPTTSKMTVNTNAAPKKQSVPPMLARPAEEPPAAATKATTNAAPAAPKATNAAPAAAAPAK